MREQSQPSFLSAAALTGDVRALVEQLGDTDGLIPADVATSLLSRPVDSIPALRLFLAEYQSRVLTAQEFPAILRAHGHANRNELRELLTLDRELADAALPEGFKLASRGVGRRQLNRLRPLRDERLVQRYRAAVEAGDAHAWHTVVFGLTLHLYSLPLRQGLLHYAQQTFGGFIRAAAPRVGLRNGELEEFLSEACAGLPATGDAALPKTGVNFGADSRT
ncbi:MAG: hypothetical protein HY300_16655 [Verrucomicrobia bacterium]|nr:hypothetical protein [Verrucomicrobiota bacterium]